MIFLKSQLTYVKIFEFFLQTILLFFSHYYKYFVIYLVFFVLFKTFYSYSLGSLSVFKYSSDVDQVLSDFQHTMTFCTLKFTSALF